MPRPVADYSTSEIVMSQQEFRALPQRVQALLQQYGTEVPQGFGRPSIIRIATYRIEELEAAMRAANGDK